MNPVRASVCALTLKVSDTGSSDLGSSACSQRPWRWDNAWIARDGVQDDDQWLGEDPEDEIDPDYNDVDIFDNEWDDTLGLGPGGEARIAEEGAEPDAAAATDETPAVAADDTETASPAPADEDTPEPAAVEDATADAPAERKVSETEGPAGDSAAETSFEDDITKAASGLEGRVRDVEGIGRKQKKTKGRKILAEARDNRL